MGLLKTRGIKEIWKKLQEASKPLPYKEPSFARKMADAIILGFFIVLLVGLLIAACLKNHS